MKRTSHFLWFLLLALALAGPVKSHTQSQPTGFIRSSRMVLIMPFESESSTPGSEWLGESFPEILSDRLHSGALLIISRNERMYAFDRLGIPPAARLSRATIYEIAQQIDADYVIMGGYSSDGSRVTAHARVMDMAQLRLSPEVTESAPLAELINLQTALAWDLMASLGPDAATTRAGLSRVQFVAQFPPVRLDALENYMRGVSAGGAQEKIRYFKEALRLEPGHILAMLELARTYFNLREYEPAASWFSKVPADGPHANEARFYQGLACFYAGQNEKAEAAFHALLSRLPLTEVYNNLGVAAARRGDKRARGYFERAVQNDPSDPDYHFNLGVQNYKEGDTAGATRQLRESLALKPDTEVRGFLEAVIAGNEARDHLPLERIKSNYDEASFRQVAAEIENINEQRLQTVDAATHAAFHVQRGRQLLEQGLAGEAEKEFREAVILDPVNAQAHTGLALVFESNQARPEARSEALASLRLKPSAEAWLVLARLDLAEHNHAEAAQNVDRALALEPENAAAQTLKHEIAVAAGRTQPQSQP
ncbi:MAG: tetratricopeptide repeat protein [Acidobacteriia bacterium]|nr:tetratricopeptide repeat protein [Terriglobia bacterium]